jgi:S1-C subfamily serine protease
LSVEPGSLAEREGLRAGDVITELAGRRCESPAQVIEAVRRQPAGTWLPITLEREGEQHALVIHFPTET